MDVTHPKILRIDDAAAFISLFLFVFCFFFCFVVVVVFYS